MPINEIVELARNISPEVTSEHIQPLAGGFSSQAFKVNTGHPFVLLVSRSGGVSKTNYGHGFAVLELLKRHNFKHAPVPLWLKEDRTAIALSYVDGVASNVFNFQANKVEPLSLALQVIDSLFDTTSVSLEEYTRVVNEYGVDPLPAETRQESALKYGTEWFRIVEEFCPDASIVSWLRPRVLRSVETANKARCEDPKFVHSDPSNPNILICNDGTFSIIDWDSARFHCSWAEYLVGYTTHLTDFMKPFYSEIVAHVAHRLGIPEKEFADNVYEYRMYAEIFDVNWAALMMTKVATGDVSDDIEKFRNIAVERIEEYEKTFS